MRAVSERDLTRSNSLNSKLRGEMTRSRYGSTGGYGPVPGPRRMFSTSDMSRPSSAASTVDFSPEEYPTKDEFANLQVDTMPCKFQNLSIVFYIQELILFYICIIYFIRFYYFTIDV